MLLFLMQIFLAASEVLLVKSMPNSSSTSKSREWMFPPSFTSWRPPFYWTTIRSENRRRNNHQTKIRIWSSTILYDIFCLLVRINTLYVNLIHSYYAKCPLEGLWWLISRFWFNNKMVWFHTKTRMLKSIMKCPTAKHHQRDVVVGDIIYSYSIAECNNHGIVANRRISILPSTRALKFTWRDHSHAGESNTAKYRSRNSQCEPNHPPTLVAGRSLPLYTLLNI